MIIGMYPAACSLIVVAVAGLLVDHRASERPSTRDLVVAGTIVAALNLLILLSS